jgi:hypothetical protein
MATLERRIFDLESRLLFRAARVHVIDAQLGDPDAQLAEYYATTPPDRHARLIVVLVNATSSSSTREVPL